MVPGVVGLGDFGHPHGNAAAHLHIGELVLPGGQGLVQGHMHIFLPLLRRHVRRLIQQAQVSNHRGKGSLQVMGQISDQIALSGRFFLQHPFLAFHVGLNLSHLYCYRRVLLRKYLRCLPGLMHEIPNLLPHSSKHLLLLP